MLHQHRSGQGPKEEEPDHGQQHHRERIEIRGKGT